MSVNPRITAIICTRDRPSLLPRALDSVLREVRDDDEIVVVDDGNDPPVKGLPSGVRIVRTSGVGPGGARAAGLDAARGLYVAWCDDDDEWLPGHLDALTAVLDAEPETALVYGDAEWEVPGRATAPRVPYSLDFEGFVLADWNYLPISAVVHRTRPARSVGGFDPQLSAFEDWDLWLRMLDAGHRLRHRAVTVTRQHWQPGSPSAAQDDKYWATAESVQAGHRNRSVLPAPRFDPQSWLTQRELVCRAIMRPYEGYGVVGTNLLLALSKRGVQVALAPEDDQFPVGTEPLQHPIPGFDRLGFYYDYRKRPWELGCERVVSYTMCESTRVSEQTIAAANASAYVLVPCRQNAEDFATGGVTVPIGVLHHGVDPAAFPYLERQTSTTYTFGTFGHLSPRKGTDVLLRAFQAEFSPDEDVRLVLKSSADASAYEIDDPRVRVVSGGLSASSLLDLLAGFDALVVPSRGEGFGLCGLEGMATGLPVIATDWSGPAEYLDPADSFPLNYRLVDAAGVESNRTRYFGQWAEPDVEHLRVLLRWLYEHPAEAAAMGRAASRRVHRHWTWERIGADLERHLDAAASLPE